MMLHIPEVLSRDEWQGLRGRLEDAEWVDGRVTVGTQGATVKRNRQIAEGSDLARELGEVVLRALARNSVYFAAALPLRVVPPLFNRYESNETYGFHVDGSVRRYPAAPGWLRTDLSATLFLCEPDEYDGGELTVRDTYGDHTVKLPAGDMILYPADSLHCVTPVTRGARVASFFWIQSMVREQHRRAMLYDLDQTIQALRQQLGETPQTLSLTNCYHNLLREWSEL